MTDTMQEDREIGGGTGEDADPRFPHRRKAYGMTIAHLRDTLEDGSRAVKATGKEIEIAAVDSGAPVIKVRTKEYRATEHGFLQLAGRVGVVPKFAKSLWEQNPDLGQHLVNELLHRGDEEHIVRVHDERGIRSTYPANVLHIEPSELAGSLANALGDQAEVSQYSVDPSAGLLLDLVAPMEHPEWWGGDRSVGDITGGGLRVTQKSSATQFHSPQLGIYLHRLVCTNGMVVTQESKVDARLVDSSEEWLAEFEVLAGLAMSRVRGRIQSFYDMRSARVARPEQWLRRVAQEQRIPDAILTRILGALVEWTAEDGSVSEFDLLNLITHFANATNVSDSVSRRLMLAGGNILGQHAMRCHTCQHRLD